MAQPRNWISEQSVRDEERSTEEEDAYDAGVTTRLEARGWNSGWLFGWRDITNAGNERAMVCSALPRVAVGNTLFLALTNSRVIAGLYANMSSFALDYVTRQKISGTHLTYSYTRQLPIFKPDHYGRPTPWNKSVALNEWITSRVLELSWTAWDMEGFARDLGDDRPPFRWDEERRARLRGELDAAYFHLYEIERGDLEYIMETFPIVKRHDEERVGEYRTKHLILEAYDAMADATRTGVPYRSIVDPPPGEGPRHDPR